MIDRNEIQIDSTSDTTVSSSSYHQLIKIQNSSQKKPRIYSANSSSNSLSPTYNHHQLNENHNNSNNNNNKKPVVGSFVKYNVTGMLSKFCVFIVFPLFCYISDIFFVW